MEYNKMESILIKLATLFFMQWLSTQIVLASQASVLCQKWLVRGNISLSVAINVTNSSIVLTCTAGTAMVPGIQYLKWMEKGNVELPDAYIISKSFTEDGRSKVSIMIQNPSTLDYGVYTCRCYNNYTVSEVQEVYYSDDWQRSYSRHCSDPVSVSATPPADDENISIVEHQVTLKNELIEINCRNGSQLLTRSPSFINASATRKPSYVLTVESPSNQGKYICTGKNMNIEQIHYIIISGYEPPVFLVPQEESATIYNTGNVLYIPGCIADLGGVQLTSMEVVLGSGQQPGLIFSDHESIGSGVHVVPIIPITTQPLTCYIETYWERIQQTYSITLNGPPEPTVCLRVTVQPSTVSYGQSFAVHCFVYSLLHYLSGITYSIHHSTINGTKSMLPIMLHDQQQTAGHNVIEYYANISKADDHTTTGEYTCKIIVPFGDSNEEQEASVVIQVQPDYTYDALQTSSFSLPTSSSCSEQPSPTFFDVIIVTTRMIPSSAVITSPASTMAITSPDGEMADSQYAISYQTSLLIIYLVSSVTAFIVIVFIIVSIVLLCCAARSSRQQQCAEVELSGNVPSGSSPPVMQPVAAVDNVYITIPELAKSCKVSHAPN